MSKYNLTDILNEYVGGSRHGTIKISYRDLQDAMDTIERQGDFVVRELPGPSGDGKTNREFEVVYIGNVRKSGKEEGGFTVYDYKFGFDPGSQEHFDEEYDFSIGGNNKKNALILARDLLGPAVKGYFGDDQKIINSYTPQMANDVIMSLDRNMDDEGEMTDYAADVEIDNMEINEENVIKDLAQADEVIKMIKMMNPDVREDLLKRIARMGQKMDEEKNGMKLSKKNYADYHKDNKKKVDELSMGKKDKDDDGESKFRSAQYGIGDAFVDAVKKRMQKEMQTLPNPIMRHGFEGDNYQEKETERMRRDGSSGESQKSMASVPFYQRDVRYDDDFFIDELNDGELDESFDSLVKKVDKAKGYSKKDAQRVAGFIANRKRAGAGSGPTKKMKKREGIKEAPGSTINLSKDDMDKLHSDGKLNIDGHKVIYKVNENGDVKDYTDEIKESSQEESLANYLIKSYTNPKTGTSLVDDEIVSDFMRTVPEWEDMFDGSEEGNDSIDKEFQDFLFLNYDSLDEVKDKKEMVKLEEHFNRFK